MFYIKASYCKE